MKLLLVSNYGMGLYKFSKELIEALIAGGNEVFISIPADEYEEKLEALGCHCLNTPVDRRGTNPFRDGKLILNYINLIRKVKPELVLTYTIKPNIYASIACRFTMTPYINNITGLGKAFETKGLLLSLTKQLYRISLRKSLCVFFQNEANEKIFLQNKLTTGKTLTTPGFGVNIREHCFEKYPKDLDEIRILFIGRIMKEKGIEELLEAISTVKQQYPTVCLELVGFCEEDYTKQIDDAEKSGLLRFYGKQEEIHNYITNCHALVLPSYHEGMANVLLEAAAAGRPILASRIDGCMQAFEEGVSGYGFEAKNKNDLTDTLIKFIQLPLEKKRAMGLAGRRKMELEFDRQMVVETYLELIHMLRDAIVFYK